MRGSGTLPTRPSLAAVRVSLALTGDFRSFERYGVVMLCCIGAVIR
jgi:hypothetical protein